MFPEIADWYAKHGKDHLYLLHHLQQTFHKTPVSTTRMVRHRAAGSPTVCRYCGEKIPIGIEFVRTVDFVRHKSHNDRQWNWQMDWHESCAQQYMPERISVSCFSTSESVSDSSDKEV